MLIIIWDCRVATIFLLFLKMQSLQSTIKCNKTRSASIENVDYPHKVVQESSVMNELEKKIRDERLAAERVRELSQQYGLEVDGKVGPNTMAKLATARATARPAVTATPKKTATPAKIYQTSSWV